MKPETFQLAVEFLALEIERTAACQSRTLILHPGAMSRGVDAGIAQVIKGLNEVLTKDTPCQIAPGNDGQAKTQSLAAPLKSWPGL